jgi:hypothetical protein
MTIIVKIHELIDFEQSQDMHFRTSAALLALAMNHPEFENLVLSAPYLETYFRTAEGKTISKSPAEILQIIVEGLERSTQTDNAIDISIKRDKKIRKPIVGITNLGKLPFRTANWFIEGCTVSGDTISVARHMTHEWLHVTGFMHKRQNGYRKDVAYLVGDIVRQLLKEMASAKTVSGIYEDPDIAEVLNLDHEFISED